MTLILNKLWQYYLHVRDMLMLPQNNVYRNFNVKFLPSVIACNVLSIL